MMGVSRREFLNAGAAVVAATTMAGCNGGKPPRSVPMFGDTAPNHALKSLDATIGLINDYIEQGDLKKAIQVWVPTVKNFYEGDTKGRNDHVLASLADLIPKLKLEDYLLDSVAFDGDLIKGTVHRVTRGRPAEAGDRLINVVDPDLSSVCRGRYSPSDSLKIIIKALVGDGASLRDEAKATILVFVVDRLIDPAKIDMQPDEKDRNFRQDGECSNRTNHRELMLSLSKRVVPSTKL